MNEEIIADKERVAKLFKQLAKEMEYADFVMTCSDGEGGVKTMWYGDIAKCYGMSKIGEHTLMSALTGSAEAEEMSDEEDDAAWVDKI